MLCSEQPAHCSAPCGPREVSAGQDVALQEIPFTGKALYPQLKEAQREARHNQVLPGGLRGCTVFAAGFGTQSAALPWLVYKAAD